MSSDCPEVRGSLESEKARHRVAVKQTIKRKEQNFPAMTQMVGNISELKVAIDLISREYNVFSSIAGPCSCDLIIFKDNGMFKVEVKTGRKNKNGRPIPIATNRTKYDILAIYFPEDDTIKYTPELN